MSDDFKDVAEIICRACNSDPVSAVVRLNSVLSAIQNVLTAKGDRIQLKEYFEYEFTNLKKLSRLMSAKESLTAAGYNDTSQLISVIDAEIKDTGTVKELQPEEVVPDAAETQE